MIVLGCVLLFAAAAVDSPVTALGDSVVLLPEVLVERERSRSAAELRQPTGFVSDLDARPPGTSVSSLPLALARAAGVRVVQYGGLGAFSTVTLRGAPASQVGILWDGEPLQSATSSVVSLGDVPAAAIDRIEVYRGPVPLGFGLPAPAGAVNLVALGSSRPLDVRVAGGSFGSWEARGAGGIRRGPIALDYNAGHQESRGDFDYHDDNGTPLNTADDSTLARSNNEFTASHVIAGLKWAAATGFDVGVRQDWFQRRQGFPGAGAITARFVEEALERSMTRFTLDRTARGATPRLHARTGIRREHSQFSDPRGELGWGRIDADDRFSGEHVALEAGWDRLPGGFSVRASGSYRTEQAETGNAADPYADPPRSTRAATGAALVVESRPGTDRILLHAARRWDRVHDDLHGLATAGVPVSADVTRELDTPQLGASVRIARGLELRGNWTDAWRAPEFGELFGNQGSVLGNLALRPEHVRTWDAGGVVRAVAGRVTIDLEYAHFESRGEDLILYRPTQASVRPYNVARVSIEGDELSLHAGAWAGVRITGSWTGQRAIDAGTWAPWTGKQLPGRPGSRLYARIDGAWGRLGAFGDVDASSLTYLDPSNRTSVPARAIVGAGAAWYVTPRLELVLEGRNLGDVRTADVLGYPLPGRSIYAACEASWGSAP